MAAVWIIFFCCTHWIHTSLHIKNFGLKSKIRQFQGPCDERYVEGIMVDSTQRCSLRGGKKSNNMTKKHLLRPFGYDILQSIGRMVTIFFLRDRAMSKHTFEYLQHYHWSRKKFLQGSEMKNFVKNHAFTSNFKVLKNVKVLVKA